MSCTKVHACGCRPYHAVTVEQKELWAKVRHAVEANPGIRAIDAVKQSGRGPYANHRSAAGVILQDARRGRIPGVQLRDEREDGRVIVRLYPLRVPPR